MYKIIKVPGSIGAPQHSSGMEKGPDILSSMLLEHHGNLDKSVISVDIPTLNNSHQTGEYERAKNLPEVKSACDALTQQVSSVIQSGYKPLVLMGDDSSAIGSVYGLLQELDGIGIVWFDQHGDINTPETSPSSCFYGMGLAHTLGYGHKEILELNKNGNFIDPNNVVMIGQTNLDSGEIKFIKEKNIIICSPEDLQKGFEEIMQQIGEKLNGISNLFLHYDLDVITSSENPAVFAPTAGGLSTAELYKITEYLLYYFNIAGINIANYIPGKDKEEKGKLIVEGLVGKLIN